MRGEDRQRHVDRAARTVGPGHVSRRGAGCDSTSPVNTSSTISAYDVNPLARPRIHGAIGSDASCRRSQRRRPRERQLATARTTNAVDHQRRSDRAGCRARAQTSAAAQITYGPSTSALTPTLPSADPGGGEVEALGGRVDAVRSVSGTASCSRPRPSDVGVDDRDRQQALSSADARPRVDQVVHLATVHLPSADPHDDVAHADVAEAEARRRGRTRRAGPPCRRASPRRSGPAPPNWQSPPASTMTLIPARELLGAQRTASPLPMPPRSIGRPRRGGPGSGRHAAPSVAATAGAGSTCSPWPLPVAASHPRRRARRWRTADFGHIRGARASR